MTLYHEETYRLEPPMLLVYEDAPKPCRRPGRRLLRHWVSGISLSASASVIAGAGFALATGHPGLGLAGVLLAAGVTTTWLSAPGGGLGVTLAAWAVLVAMFVGLGQVDPIAGLVVWLLLLGALLAGIVRACR